MPTMPREYMQEWRKGNPGKQAEYDRRWRKKNWQKFLAAERARKSTPVNREKVAARTALNKAVARGKVRKPLRCRHCRKVVPLQAHHHRGYAEKYHLDVVWMCRSCHRAAEA